MNFNTNIRYDFINNRNKFFLFSIALTLAGILSILIINLNFGVDFKAGTNMDVLTGQSITQQQAKEVLEKAGFAEVIPTVGGAGSDRVSIRFDEVLVQAETTAVLNQFKEAFGEGVSAEVNVVSAEMAQEQGINAIWAILIASIGIMLYVMIRFEWRFALAANIGILYDGFVVVAIFSLFRLEVDLTFIAAVLTTIGYSINDKIVIFDRVRENMRFSPVKNEEQLTNVVNASLWQTMARNIYTVLAVIVVALSILIFGSDSIRLFSLAMLIGLVSSIYSTLCISPALYVLMKRKQKPKVAVKPTP